MTSLGPVVRGAALVVSALSLLTVAGCSDAAVDVAPLEVEFTVELQEGQAWRASGPAVDVDLMCTEGHRRWLGAQDLAGNHLTDSEVQGVQREARATRTDPAFVLLQEWICADGRGAFISGERVAEDSWAITSGTGSFAGLTGTGTISFVETLEANPESLYIDASLTSGP